jgi:hypothetical protein
MLNGVEKSLFGNEKAPLTVSKRRALSARISELVIRYNSNRIDYSM